MDRQKETSYGVTARKNIGGKIVQSVCMVLDANDGGHMKRRSLPCSDSQLGDKDLASLVKQHRCLCRDHLGLNGFPLIRMCGGI